MNHEAMINKFLRSMVNLMTLRYTLQLFTGWCFAWGIVVIVLRILVGTSQFILLWGATALLPIVFLSYLRAMRQLPAVSEIRALLDQENQCGGILMALGEIDVGGWQKQIPQLRLPNISWQSSRTCKFFVLAVLFVGLSFFTPQRFVAVQHTQPLDIQGELQNLSEQVEILQNEEMIDSIQAQSLEQKVEDIRREASGENPGKTLESLDYLTSTIEKTAKEAAQAALQENEELSQAQTLAQGIVENSGTIEPKVLSQAMAELAAMTEKAAVERKQLQKRLSPSTLTECRKGNLKPEEVRNILEAIRKRQGDIHEALKKLRERGLVDNNTVNACEKQGQCNTEGLAKFLNENGNRMTVPEMVKIWSREGQNSSGSPTEGPGDASMDFWDTPTSEQGVKFKEQILPPSALSDFKNSKLIGISPDAPHVENSDQSVTHGALSESSANSGSAFTQTILPRHRATIKRYFKRD